jgi:hypothetical protein
MKKEMADERHAMRHRRTTRLLTTENFFLNTGSAEHLPQ